MLLLLRCLRVDRVVVGITHFVIQTLGERYVTPPVLDYHAIFRQSTPTTPVVFVLSPGADPAFDVFRCGLGDCTGFARFSGVTVPTDTALGGFHPCWTLLLSNCNSTLCSS